ncbi:MAG: hypothetical protein LAT62_02230 [Natronospirillum sp.]|uniref:hypothetical protein n=1 Tax=Natronospirillum sp. TaxID=2812955 RepID=UPI0025CC1734|nr:hypothetical protein [Natronospirillum sp.]MCH8550724.1 hypothetical protein [Natronospirillum sp.]
METLNHHYLTRNQVHSSAPSSRVPDTGLRYRIYLRAHLESGYRTPKEHLRQDITGDVPGLATLSYQAHVVPLAKALQLRLEQHLGVLVRSVDVEVQYEPA